MAPRLLKSDAKVVKKPFHPNVFKKKSGFFKGSILTQNMSKQKPL